MIYFLFKGLSRSGFVLFCIINSCVFYTVDDDVEIIEISSEEEGETYENVHEHGSFNEDRVILVSVQTIPSEKE